MAGPRIRSLKHTFFSDEKVAEFPLQVRYTFAGLIAHADDEGRLKGDPRLIKAQIWPLDDEITPARVCEHLTRLASGSDPRIRWYRVNGRQFVEVINFRKHQYIQKPKPSELPASDQADTPIVHVPDGYVLDGMGMDGKGTEGNATSAPPPLVASRTPEPTDDPTPPFTKPEPPRVVLPPQAEKFVTELYGFATKERQADVRRQLYDAIDPAKRGAKISSGVYVKARSADHLDRVCLAVRMDPPQKPDIAIVYVLRKLQQAETNALGQTVTEAASYTAKTEVAADFAAQDAYEAAAKDAGVRWQRQHPDQYAAIVARIDARFGDVSMLDEGAWQRSAKESALLLEIRRACDFPDFATWSRQRARASPVAKAG